MNFGIKTSDDVIPITKKVIKIGRHTSNDVVLNNLKVTRYHAEIRVLENRIFIVDNNTLNGTFLEDTRILPDRELLLKIGDNIGVGCKVTDDCTNKLMIVLWRNEDTVTTETSKNEPNELSRQAINVNFNVFFGDTSNKSSNELQQVLNSSNLGSAVSNSSLVSTLLPKINSAISSVGIIDQKVEKCKPESSTVLTETVSFIDKTNSVLPSSNCTSNCSNSNDPKDTKGKEALPTSSTIQIAKSSISDPEVDQKCVEVSQGNVMSSNTRILEDLVKPLKETSCIETESSKLAVEDCQSISSAVEESKSSQKTNEVHSPSPSTNKTKSRKRCREQNNVSIPQKASKIKQPSVIMISDSEEENIILEEEELISQEENSKNSSEQASANHVLNSNVTTTNAKTDAAKNLVSTSSDSLNSEFATKKKEPHFIESINLVEDDETEICTKKTSSNFVSESSVPPVEVKSAFSGKSTNKSSVSKTLPSEIIDLEHEPTSRRTEHSGRRDIIDLSSESNAEQDVKPLLPFNANYSNTDDIITLDSDDDDFPMSQFDASCVDNVTDFSSDLQKIYDYPTSDDESEKPAIKLECGDVMWFQPVAQNDLVEGKRIMRSISAVDSETENDSLDTDEGHMAKDSVKFLEADEQCNMSVEADEKCGIIPVVSERLTEFSSKHNERFSSDKYELLSRLKNETNEVKELIDAEIERRYKLKSLSVKLPRIDSYNFKNRSKRNEDGILRGKESEREMINDPKIVLETNQEKLPSKEKEEHMGRKERMHPSGRMQTSASKSSFLLKHPQNILKNYSKKHRPLSVSEIRMTKDIKKKRKEKLKKIACKETSAESSCKIVPRSEAKPAVAVAKITQNNRNTKLAEAFLNTRPSVKKDKVNPTKSDDIQQQITRIHENIETSLNIKTFKVNKMTFVTPCSDSDLIDDLIKRHCPREKLPSSTTADPTPEDNNNEPTKPKLPVQKSVPQLKISKNIDSSSAIETNICCTKDTTEEDKPVEKPLEKPVEVNSEKPKVKSILKKNKPNFTIDKNDILKRMKTVKVNLYLNNCKYFESDSEERRNNGIFAPAYKLNEQLIRESGLEFEAAIAKVCSWSVRWLGEQQKNTEPPPLYPEGQQNENIPDLCKKYKEYVKGIMFCSLWKAMFHSWNKPDNDFLPHTQYITETQNNTCALRIEAVDDQNPGQLWTITASRLLSPSDDGDEAMKGQIVILNFHVMRATDKEAKKTMVFAYVANVVKIFCDNRFIQRMWFKIYAKPFKIELGIVKVKILNYLKSHLRPFQALAMVTRSPLTNFLIDSSAEQCVEPLFGSGEEAFSDKFLDACQRKAIASCLNSIHSTNPSVCLVDGAAGTGKTQVIVSLLKELFSKNTRNQFPDDLKILIVTVSDHVADDISYRVEAINKKEKCMNLLRYGNCKGMHFSMKNCTLDKQVNNLVKEDGQKLINLSEEINNLRAKINSIKLVLESQSAKPEKIADARLKLTAGDKELRDMESENSRIIEQLKSHAAKEITVENADVVVTSMYSCWSSSFESDFIPSNANKGDIHKFTVCIFDDANHVNEIGMLVPMMLMVRSLILIGDQKNWMLVNQLKSPFFRLIQNAPNAVMRLNHEYRLHPSVMQWVDECFPPKCEKRSIPLVHRSPLLPFIVINICQDQGIDESEKYEEQATFCAKLIEKFDQLEEPKFKFGVVIAHENQKEIIRSSLPLSILEKRRKVVVDRLEEFSGREQDVVIVCLPYRHYNFDSWLYVAATRARSSLIVCGDFSHIQNVRSVSSLLMHAKRRNVYVSVNSNDDVPADYFVKNQKAI